MTEPEMDLAALFNSVTEVLGGKKDSLNEADSFNHDHGDHMLENFKVITEALKQKEGATPAEQLAFASEKLSQDLNTGSAKVYSERLALASNQLQGQRSVTTENIMSLVQALLGGGVNEAPHQSQSGQAIGGSLISILGTLLGKKKPRSKPGRKPAAKSKAKKKPKTRPKSSAKPESKPKPKTKPKPRTKPKPKKTPKTKPKLKPKRKPK